MNRRGRQPPVRPALPHTRASVILAFVDHLWTPWRYAYVTQEDTRESRAGVPAALAAWPGDRHCVFCNLIAAADYAIEHGMAEEAADRAANIVLRGKTCYICLNAYPYTSGHVMIVPHAHEASLGGLAAETALEMMALAQRTSRALERAYSPDGANLGLNLGKAAGAGVADHLHMHVLPRWFGDTNFMTVTAETRVLPEILEQSWHRLREAFAGI
ncbi:MAG TPA: HIT domain-containing protein [Acidobacteriaceae bacterium]|jgi:ATP adenylyltransferase|nr:HIT domain-containing protein [Acidobacteriaceae bacterium]